MAATFPGGIKSFSAVVNGVTKLVAALFNSPYDEITAIETALGVNMVNVRFGAWDSSSWSIDTPYLAATDGFVIGISTRGSVAADIIGYSDSATPPTVQRCRNRLETDGGTQYACITMPVKKGDYWKVSLGDGSITSLMWIPLGG